MTIKTRPQLKSFFVKNAIPTEGNFADLIDTQLNQSEDGVFKVAGEPLSVVAAPGAPRRVLRFYSSVPAQNPDWLIGLNPAQDPNNPATARLGFGVTDATGVPRLFIDAATGNVGVGTNSPGDNKLHVSGNGQFTGTLLANGRIDANTGVTVTGNIIANTNIGVGTVNPLARLHVEGNTRINGALIVINGGANISSGLTVSGPVVFSASASVTSDSPVTARLGLTVSGGQLAAQAITAAGTITASGGITVPSGQAVGFDSLVNARLGLAVTGAPLTVGTAQANQNLTVNGGIVGTGALNVTGNIVTNGNIGIGGSNADYRLLVSGVTRILGNLGAMGGLDVGSGFSANFDSVVNVRAGLNVLGSNVVVGTAQANQSLTVHGSVQATGPLNVTNGGVFANGPNSALMIGTNALVVSNGNTGLGVVDTAGNRLRVAGSARVDGTLTASATVSLPAFGRPLATAARGVLLNRPNAQHIVLPTFPDTVGFESGLTIQAWIYINTYGDFSRIVELGNGINNNNILFFIGIDGSLGGAMYQGNSAGNFWNVRTPPGTLPLKSWTHVAITVEPSEGVQGIIRFYCNGFQIAVNSILMPPKVARTTNYIGRSSWTPQDPYFDGSIAEVSVWSGPRAIVQGPLVGNEAGLLGYWKLADNALDFKSTPLGNGNLAGSPAPSFALSADLDDWRSPTLTAPWVEYSSGYNLTGYLKDPSGFVHLRGLVRTNAPNSNVAASGRLFTLPAGYRPQFSELFATISDQKLGRIDIPTTGDVFLSMGSTQWFSLDGITFRAHH